ncbi:MAG: M23 family metallopeptidase [Alphaproteobacteria bacterium]|nr:M23 family metallopeptidase [Alphaproteobacteria bacterium]
MLIAMLYATAADALELQGDLVQGGLIRGHTERGTTLVLDGRPVRVSAEGFFAFGFGRESLPRAVLTILHVDGRREERVLAIAARSFPVQRIDGLPQGLVTPAPADLARIRRAAELIAELRARDTEDTGFRYPFRWPVTGPISGVYGSQRVLNGEPRRPHFGVDVAAPVGTPVRAPAPGRVTLAERDLYFTGGTVMLDHGHGVTSVYSHLASVVAQVGAELKAGDLLGTVGATGRVTGAHLDWRVSWFEVPIDPALLAGPMPTE